MSSSASQFEPAEESSVQGFSDFESALESLHSNGIDGSFDDLVRYFSAPDRESNIEPMFNDLDFHSRVRLIEFLMREVFEGVAYHHLAPMIVYRKGISQALRVTKGEVGMENALSEARIGRPDSAILFFRANPSRIKAFIGELSSQYPEEAQAVTLSLVEHLFSKLQESAH